MPNNSSEDDIVNIMPHVTDPHMKSKYPIGKVSPKVLMREMDVDDDEFEIPQTEKKTKEEENVKPNYMNIAYIVLALVIIALVILVVYLFLKQNEKPPMDIRPILVPQNRIPPHPPAEKKVVTFKEPVAETQPPSPPPRKLTSDIPRDNVSKDELDDLDMKVLDIINEEDPIVVNDPLEKKPESDNIELNDDDRKYITQMNLDNDEE